MAISGLNQEEAFERNQNTFSSIATRPRNLKKHTFSKSKEMQKITIYLIKTSNHIKLNYLLQDSVFERSEP